MITDGGAKALRYRIALCEPSASTRIATSDLAISVSFIAPARLAW